MPWFFQEFETINILATTLKFNEKKDIAYLGKTLTQAVEKMQCNAQRLSTCASYDPEVDEIPF